MAAPDNAACPNPNWRGTPTYTAVDVDAPPCPDDVVPPPAETAGSYGCGLKVVGSTVSVDNVELAGDPEDTALVPDGTCGLAFDTAIASTVSIDYVTDASFFLGGGDLVMSVTKRTIVDRYNIAGVLVDRVYGTPVSTEFPVPQCLPQECCEAAEAGPFTVTPIVDPAAGDVDTVFEFTSNVGNGVVDFEYEWNFGDGSATSDSPTPTHTYTDPGYYQVTLTVTDACERTTVNYIYVVVTVEPCDCPDAGEIDGSRPYTYTFTLSGGTVDFDSANGEVVLYLTTIGGFCKYVGGLHSWLFISRLVPPDYTMHIDGTDALTAATLDFEGDPLFPSSFPYCNGFSLLYQSKTGTGTNPTVDGSTIGSDPTVPLCDECAIPVDGMTECSESTPIETDTLYVTTAPVAPDIGWFDLGVLTADADYHIEITSTGPVSYRASAGCEIATLLTGGPTSGTFCVNFHTYEVGGTSTEIGFSTASSATVTFKVVAGSCP